MFRTANLNKGKSCAAVLTLTQNKKLSDLSQVIKQAFRHKNPQSEPMLIEQLSRQAFGENVATIACTSSVLELELPGL